MLNKKIIVTDNRPMEMREISGDDHTGVVYIDSTATLEKYRELDRNGVIEIHDYRYSFEYFILHTQTIMKWIKTVDKSIQFMVCSNAIDCLIKGRFDKYIGSTIPALYYENCLSELEQAMELQSKIVAALKA